MYRNGIARTTKVAIIAAMEREVRPLVQSWKVRDVEHAGRHFRFFGIQNSDTVNAERGEDQNWDVVAVCSGIGPEAARRSTEMVIELFHPEQVVSAGFAGAIDDAAVGEIIEPRMVINAADGSRTDTGSGEGVLVSVAAIADQMQKAQFGQSYGAVAVDMEAASVALGAQARGVRFRALKVISDASDFSMPDMDRFVSADGNFRSAQFALHVALRPAIWGRTIALACNSAKASRALSAALDNYIRREFRAQASDQTSNNERGVKHPVPETQDARSAHS